MRVSSGWSTSSRTRRSSPRRSRLPSSGAVSGDRSGKSASSYLGSSRPSLMVSHMCLCRAVCTPGTSRSGQPRKRELSVSATATATTPRTVTPTTRPASRHFNHSVSPMSAGRNGGRFPVHNSAFRGSASLNFASGYGRVPQDAESCHTGARSSSRVASKALASMSQVRKSPFAAPRAMLVRVCRCRPDASASCSNVIPDSARAVTKISRRRLRSGSGDGTPPTFWAALRAHSTCSCTFMAGGWTRYPLGCHHHAERGSHHEPAAHTTPRPPQRPRPRHDRRTRRPRSLRRRQRTDQGEHQRHLALSTSIGPMVTVCSAPCLPGDRLDRIFTFPCPGLDVGLRGLWPRPRTRTPPVQCRCCPGCRHSRSCRLGPDRP